jgi:two-component system catabolic regulation response regulator CreB
MSCEHAVTAADGLKKFREGAYDLVLLDVGLPDQSGFDVCRQIRSGSKVPLFFLTARAEEVDRVLGLELGADDYITKPFSPRELTARIRAFFRRFDSSEGESPRVQGAFEILEDRYQIRLSGKDLGLRKYEFAILKLLLENPGRVFSRTQIMERIWEDPQMSLERTIDTHVKVIRAQLKDVSDEEWILTHRGLGYSFKELT